MRSCKWSFSPGITFINSVRLVSRKLSSSDCIASHTCGIKCLTEIIAFWWALKYCNSCISICSQWMGVSSDALSSAIRQIAIVVTSGQVSIPGGQTSKSRSLCIYKSILETFASSFVPCKTNRTLLLSQLITVFSWYRRDFSKGSQL